MAQRVVVLLATGLVILSVVGVAAQNARRPPAEGKPMPSIAMDDLAVPIAPVRRGSAPPLPAIPSLPPTADQLVPLTLRLTVVEQPATGDARRTSRTVTRTIDKIHVRAETSEWLFERNPVDPRRVSGVRVDHESREIVFHSDSDLRSAMRLEGWAHVLTLGFDHRLLGARATSGEVKWVSDVPFNRMTLMADQRQMSDVWWNEAHALPAMFTTTDRRGAITTTVVGVDRRVDDTVLQPPAMRYPQYRVVDFAEWLEQR